MPNADAKEKASQYLESLGKKAVRYITRERMVSFPNAGPRQMNIRSGFLAASITSKVEGARMGSRLEVGSTKTRGGSFIGWQVQEEPPMDITPTSRMFMAVPLGPALNPNGTKIASSPRQLSRMLDVDFFVLSAGRSLFLAANEDEDMPTLYYELRSIVPSKSAKILRGTVNKVILPSLRRNKELFKEARVYVRGELVANVRGKLGEAKKNPRARAKRGGR